MDRPSEQPGYSDILESIFAASKLEDAILWREAILERLTGVLRDTSSKRDLSADEVRLHQEAILHTNLALENLRFCLLNNERMMWNPAQRGWLTTAVWSNWKPCA